MKAKLAELLAEESFLIKRQMAENEAEKLKVQQEIAKAKARSRVFETSAIEGRGLTIEQYSTEVPLIIGNSKHGEKHGILTNQDMKKEYGIFLNQGKKETQLVWRMKKFTEQWQQDKQILPVCSAIC